MKKVIGVSVAAAIAVALSGCGSSSDGDTGTEEQAVVEQPTETSPAVETGTGYYVDSAIAGVAYVCGTQRGITGQEGEFTFEKGASCQFSLASIPLREVNATDLEEGKRIIEDNVKVAQLLQSIDADNNLTNGIQITEEIVEVVSQAVESLNDPQEVLEETTVMQEVVANVGNVVTEVPGELRSEAEVLEHLAQTQTEATKALFAGKTLYAYWEEDGEKYVAEVTINADVTSWQYQTILGGSGSGTEGLVVSGDVLSIDHPEEDELDPYKVLAKDQYVELRNINGDSVLYFYYDKVDAESAFNAGTSSSGDEEPITKFSTEWLNGKTLYFVQYDDFGYDGEGEPGMQWNMARMDFTENTMSWTEYDLPDTSTHTFNYDITSDGKINVNEEHFDPIELQSQTDDYLKVCAGSDCNIYLFFDENKAKEFRDRQNNSTETGDIEMSISLLSQNPWYVVEDDGSEHWCDGKFTFREDQSLSVSWYDNNGDLQKGELKYSIEDGLLVVAHDEKIEKNRLLSVSDEKLITEKKAYDESTGEIKHTMNQIFFSDYNAMLKEYSNCDQFIPQ